MKKILVIVGSLRKASFNKALAASAVSALSGKAEVSALDYAAVPLFSQDLENPDPEGVKAVKEQVKAADGLVIVTPEYNGLVPGVLKNLLDWLSRSPNPMDRTQSAIWGKKAAILGVGGSNKTAGARANLAQNLANIGVAVLPEQVGLALPVSAWMTGKWTPSADDAKEVAKQMDAFVSFLD